MSRLDGQALKLAHSLTVTRYDPEHNQRAIPDLKLCAKWFVEVCRGLLHLHQHKMMHRDLKPLNILLYQEVGGTHARLCDFGLAKESPMAALAAHTKGACTLFYMSPEILMHTPYGISHDIWSMGTIFGEVIMGELVFTGLSYEDTLDDIASNFGFRPLDIDKDGEPTPVTRE